MKHPEFTTIFDLCTLQQFECMSSSGKQIFPGYRKYKAACDTGFVILNIVWLFSKKYRDMRFILEPGDMQARREDDNGIENCPWIYDQRQS